MAWRNPWFLVRMSLFALVCVLLIGGAVYWNAANQLPPYVRPPVVLPQPNAYDDYAAAAAICRAAGGSGVRYAAHPVLSGRLRGVVGRNRAALARLRQGFGKQSCAPPVVSDEQTFPELAGYRDVARVLVAEGNLAAREGRMADAARSYRDCLRFGVDVPHGGTLIHGYVGLALQEIGLRAIEEDIDRFDGPTAASLMRQVRALELRATSLADTLVGQKEASIAILMDELRRGSVWQAVLPDEANTPLIRTMMDVQYGFPSKRTLLAHYRAFLDDGIAAARQPYYARVKTSPPRDGVIQFLGPGLSRPRMKWAVRDARWRIIQLRLAAWAYQSQHGAPPASAEALVPTYLTAVPRDPFADLPLVYRVKGGRAIVYSRGPDGKDDGGKDLGDKAYLGKSGDIVTLKAQRM
jgi:hypothetical protein